MKERLKFRIAMLTYKAWHPLVVLVLIYCKRKCIITDAQLYEITAMLDRTQKHFAIEKASRHCLP